MYLIEKRLLGRASIVLREYLTKKLNRKAEILLLKKEGGKKKRVVVSSKKHVSYDHCVFPSNDDEILVRRMVVILRFGSSLGFFSLQCEFSPVRSWIGGDCKGCL